MSKIKRLLEPQKNTYIIRRTSLYDSDEKPCDEAYKVELMLVDCRPVDDPKKIPINNGTDGDWYERGTNHRVVNGRICRDLYWYQEWAVDVEDIMDFVDKYGTIILGKNNAGFGTIEIYDDYRE